MAAVAQCISGSVLKDPLPNPHLGFVGGCGLGGKRLNRVFPSSSSSSSSASASNGSRVQCALAVVPKKKDNLLAAAEERWLRAMESPLEGLNFTQNDFSQALSKFDFNFELGQTVSRISLSVILLFIQLLFS